MSILIVLSPSSESSLRVLAQVLITTGVTTGVTAIFGSAAGILATTLLSLLAFSYGVRMGGAEYVRVLTPQGDLIWSLCLGSGVFAVGLILLLSRDRPYPVSAGRPI
ncbi:hypothetical protein [Mumia zhuanghuii]|uniref:Uncharacterized protein n=1 Tax=Mumia zhuanghuii TaxID=2585211 RepID=A0A5C4LYW3_9ACTN|nr:hypothetical protein [Mumia zhuanghuii]TNC23461.1 hypothetical protein FHE65_35560 [Mumia zhuanghuii]TNC23486.1 hypothetical protein FHE65_35545 [Mumia zhuanghuii]